jgi:hypothetical protein
MTTPEIKRQSTGFRRRAGAALATLAVSMSGSPSLPNQEEASAHSLPDAGAEIVADNDLAQLPQQLHEAQPASVETYRKKRHKKPKYHTHIHTHSNGKRHKHRHNHNTHHPKRRKVVKAPVGSIVESPHNTPLPATHVEAPQEPVLENLHPESLTVPEEISTYFRKNVTYLPATGCSGSLVRNWEGLPVGIQTAQHSSMLPKHGRFETAADGTPQVRFGQRFDVYTGDRGDQLTKVGHVAKFLLNSQADSTRDIVYGGFDGINPEHIAVHAQIASAAELATLKKGDVVYASGWPVDQPNSGGTLRRQEWPMHILGDDEWQIDNGLKLKGKVAALPNNPNSTECSPGDSGAVVIDSNQKNLGVMSAYNDFGAVYNKDPDKAASYKAYIEAKFGVSMDGYMATCFIVSTPPSRDQGAYIANVADA